MIKDYQIFKDRISNIISNSSLDIGVVYFIFKDIFRDIETAYYSQINNELIAESQKQQNTDSTDEKFDEKTIKA